MEVLHSQFEIHDILETGITFRGPPPTIRQVYKTLESSFWPINLDAYYT